MNKLILSTDSTFTLIILMYALIAIGALYMLFIITWSMIRNYRRLKAQKQLVKEALENRIAPSDEFLSARKKLLFSKADEAGLNVRWRSVVKVYGVAIDWIENGQAHFFIAFLDGRSYRFPQDSAEGPGRETEDSLPEIRNLIAEAAALKKHAQFTIDTALPARDEVKFWLLTTDGLHVGKGRRGEMGKESAWWKIYCKVLGNHSGQAPFKRNLDSKTLKG